MTAIGIIDGKRKPTGMTSDKAGSKSGNDEVRAGATRRAILDLLKRDGPTSSTALGDALGITPMAARLQLYELETDGLAEKSDLARGRGRPTKIWALTSAAARIFPDAHQGLAVEMINSVRELFGEKGLEKLVAKHGDMQRVAYGKRLSGASTIGARVKRLAEARNDEGYMAEARKEGRDWLLIENHCPICSAAKVCSGLCAGELRVFQDVLGKDYKIEREEHILSGARRCAYRVSKK